MAGKWLRDPILASLSCIIPTILFTYRLIKKKENMSKEQDIP
jgi:hypothetical protein